MPERDQTDRAVVEHWFDFICPFCYVGQSRTALLRKRIAWSGPALSLSEVVRRRHPAHHDRFVATVFDAYFGEGHDIEQPETLSRCLVSSGIDDPASLIDATGGEGEAAVDSSERRAHEVGVTGTPAWLIGETLVTGLRPADAFTRLAWKVAA